jgi:hypothetical protein
VQGWARRFGSYDVARDPLISSNTVAVRSLQAAKQPENKTHRKRNGKVGEGTIRLEAERTILFAAPFPVGLRSPLCLGMPARGPPPFFFMGLPDRSAGLFAIATRL